MRHTVYDAVDLLHVRRDMELFEHLGQARHDPGVQQSDRIDVLEA
jgi:hypothetical protein